MKKEVLSLIFILITLLNFGQKNDSLLVLDEVPFNYKVIDCKNVTGLPHCDTSFGLTSKDFFKKCYSVKTYKTNKKNIYYQKEFNCLNFLIAEGIIKKQKLFIRAKGQTFFKTGIWKEYDYENKKIHFIEYLIAHSEGSYYGVIVREELEDIK